MKLELTNVGVLGPGKTIIDLQPGINAVVGENGTGKSTIANALYFAVTGTTISGINLDELITWGCPNMTVKLTGDDFIIERSLNTAGTSKAYFQRGDGEKITRKSEIDQAVCNMFGILDKSVFKLVYFAEQFKAIDFIDSSDSERIAGLLSVFGFSQLEKKRTELQRTINDLNVAMVAPELVSNIEKQLSAAQQDLTDYIKEQSEVSSNILSEDKLLEYKSIVDSVPEGTKSSINSDIQANDYLKLKLIEELESLPKPPSAEDTAKYYEAVSIQSNNEKRKELENKLAALGEEPPLPVAKLEEFAQSIRDQISSENNKIKNLLERKNLIADGKCPLTKGLPCPDLLAYTDNVTVDKDIQDINTVINDLNKDLTEVKNVLELARNYERSSSILNAQLNSLPPHSEVTFDIDNYQKLQKESGEVKSRVDEIQLELAKCDTALGIAKAELAKLADKNEASNEQIEEAENRIKDSIQAKSKADLLARNISDAESRLAESRQAKELADSQNATAQENLAVKDILTKIRQAFHRDNIPKLLIDELLEVLNYQLDIKLAGFDFPYKVKWVSGGSLIYYTSDDSIHSAARLSGGQKYVLVIALRQCIASLLSTRFPLFVLDEPTTGLDVKNREALANTLQKSVSADGKLYMLIPTHDPKLLPDANIIKL